MNYSISLSKFLLSRSRKLFNQSAQGMVEFALTIPIILLLIVGIIEGGRLIFMYTSLAAAGREAARYGAGIGSLGSGTILYNDCAGIRDAAKRIGRFAGVTDAGIHISHDTGPGTAKSPYCALPKTVDTVTFVKGDRIYIIIDLSYSTMVQLIPIPPLTLYTENAHTVLMGAEVVAVTPPVIPGAGLVCDVTPYTIDSESNPQGSTNVVTIKNASGPATTIVNVLLIWDGTGGPVLQSISALSGAGSGSGVSSINSSGPSYTKDVTWSFPTGTSTFTITFSKVLKTNVIIRLTLTGVNECSFGK